MELSFRLDDGFVQRYNNRKVEWGFPSAAGMTLGELIYLRTYSRLKEDGTKERWEETVRRVVEGSFSIQKDYIENVTHTTWDADKAQRSAREMYDRMYSFKFWAPGRGLENMGTDGVNGWGFADRLYNCAFQSTYGGGSSPFARLFSKSMRGVGVGYDTEGAGADVIRRPTGHFPYSIPDSTEGWVESTSRLLDSFLHGTPIPKFSYTNIRKKGSPIASGGVAPGPEPLIQLHNFLEQYYYARIGQHTTSRTIADTGNNIGKAVVSGGKRRTALLLLGHWWDRDFMNLKNPLLEENAARLDRENGWAFAANHSVQINSTDNLDLSEWAAMQINGEPGLFLTDLTQNFGRMVDGYQHITDFATGVNPCGEISLEDNETCNVVSVNLDRHTDVHDYLRTLKFAFLYAKSVTLMPTSWPETNLVQGRNRRIGISLTGISQFLQKHSEQELAHWMDEGYRTIREWDKVYSWWFGTRESIKVTTIKPEGSASLLAGATPGVHYPVQRNYIRRVQFANTDPLLEVLDDAGYYIEPHNGTPDTTSVVELPVRGADVPTQDMVPLEQQLRVALIAQRYWADNAVSFTLPFHPQEVDKMESAIWDHWGQFKSITTMPIYDDSNLDGREMQLPYEGVDVETLEKRLKGINPVDLERVYGGDALEQVGDRFCDGDVCVL